MRIGVPREIKANEHRVGLTPASVQEICGRGHQVLVETSAGTGIGALDEHYRQAGASIAADAAAVFAGSELIVKVKEPQATEIALLTPRHTLFTYLHLAADVAQARGLMASGATAIAYETVTASDGSLPLLAPMSEVAGRLAVQAGARCLEKVMGGAGVLLGGVPGVAPAEVLVIGGGVVGSNAIRMALGLEAQVTVLDQSLPRLRALAAEFGSRLNTIYSTRERLEHYATRADLLIGAVLVPGAAAPKLVSRELVSRMKPGSVIVDVAIDQGGCVETSRPTTHAEPTFLVDGVVHYCVANMPGAVPRTSAQALNNATLPFVLKLAALGTEAALQADAHLARGLNIAAGRVTHEAVALATGLPFTA
ncbi:MAG: alanine dehydrogenase [Gammaproteobacteria bacterium]|nr:alanine dehydrogenase [Gammaproteobacteria bacterium]